MNIRPLHDRVVVRRLEEEAISSGGIVLPDSATEKPSQGEILAAGPGKMTDGGDVRPLGPSVTFTASARTFTPSSIRLRASSPNFTSLALIAYFLLTRASGRKGLAFQNPKNFAFAQDEKFFSINLDSATSVLAKYDLIACLNI